VSDSTFDILFYGVVKPGHDPEQARANLATLFKTDRARVDRLFSGNEVVIKQGVDETTAKRYQAAFAQAGLVCQVRPSAAAPAADGAFGLAADGSPLAPESAPPPPAPDTSHLSAAEVGADVLEGVEHAPPPPPPDTSHLSTIEVEAGLLDGVERAPPPTPPDTSHLSAAEAGADVLVGVEHAPPPPAPDTSHLSAAEVGVDLLEGIESSAPPPAPDTSHLALDDDEPDR
jgi:hypothetical protein